MNDSRLAGSGLADLTTILCAAYSAPESMDRIIAESGLDQANIRAGGKPRDRWSATILEADCIDPPEGLNRLLTTVRFDLESAKSAVVLGKLDGWLQRGARHENVTAAIMELIANMRVAEEHIVPQTMKGLLEAIRGAILDISRALDAGQVDEAILAGSRPGERAAARDAMVASCRRARSATDQFLAALLRIEQLRSNRRTSVTKEDVLLAREDAINTVLFERREVLEEHMRELRILLERHLPAMTQRRPSAGRAQR